MVQLLVDEFLAEDEVRDLIAAAETLEVRNEGIQAHKACLIMLT